MKFIVSVLLSVASVINAQNLTNTAQPIATAAVPTSSVGQLTETYPTEGAVPSAKPEWLELIKNAKITDAPVLKSQGSDGPSTSGQDLYCDWAKTGCMGTSIGDCPKGLWGLTYDDGPSEVSPILYDFLKSTNQKATLFMIGSNVIKYPQTVRRAFDEGHEIAIHTWTHSYMTTLTNERIVAELKWTELAIKEITGRSPRLFRPPYGDIDNRVRDIGTALGFTSVIWDHDTNDWMLAENSPGFQADWIDGNFSDWIAEASTSTTGGLSLEHDIQKVTVDAAIKNLPALQKAYKVVTVGECAGIPSYKESNSTTPVNMTSASSVIPSATLVSVVPAAPTVSPTQIAKQVTTSVAGSVHTASLSLILFAASICTFYLF